MDFRKDKELGIVGVEISLVVQTKQWKMCYFVHILRKNRNCLEKELIQGTFLK